MEEYQVEYFNNWLLGLMTMTFLHNLIVSILLYMTRQSNISNILKIIFNLSGLLRILSVFVIIMVPYNLTLSTCRSLSYASGFANLCFRESLAIFLLWRLRQIEHREFDKWISLVLIFIRTIANLIQLALSKPFIGDQDCYPNPNSAKIPIWIVIGCDFLIEIYATIRLVKILKRANRNAAQINSNMERRTKRTLFTAVMYWNFLRLAIAFIISVVSSVFVELVNISSSTHSAIHSAILFAFTIMLSYVITVDAEIVRVIEGKSKKGSYNSSSEKSIPGTPRVPATYQKKLSPHKSYPLPKYKPSMEQEENDDDDIIVSMKRLSFFEWAKIVVGFRRGINNDERNFKDEDIEEIIDRPPDFSSNDVERGSSQNNDKRRSSNFSNSTIVTADASLVKESDFA